MYHHALHLAAQAFKVEAHRQRFSEVRCGNRFKCLSLTERLLCNTSIGVPASGCSTRILHETNCRSVVIGQIIGHKQIKAPAAPFTASR
jgi:hypothetical protein